MKIVVLDGYTLNPGDLSWKEYEELGEFICYDRTPEELVAERIGDADAVFTNKSIISRASMDKCPNIKYIGVLATGYNIVDVDAAKEKGIVVSNVPTYGTVDVSQFAIALLLEICHHVGHHSEAVKAGKWARNPDWSFWEYPLVELDKKTMGIIGFGKIGQRTAHIAVALGMNILAYDEFPNPANETENIKYVDLDTLLENSDVISLHCPLFPSTRGIINKNTISKMKDGVFIVNTSRGQLVVEDDMYEALKSGKVGHFATDVVSTEPIKDDNILLKAPNCIITPHIAWAPSASRARLMKVSVDNLKSFLNGNPICVVNK
ncbi:MAG: D-2-hydroxyacid dehydrogenase [Lachnospiraceae bacterium]|nr:D-2-hydroxyacid dehydrogenase [Lachnospiraceae bacterium]